MVEGLAFGAGQQEVNSSFATCLLSDPSGAPPANADDNNSHLKACCDELILVKHLEQSKQCMLVSLLIFEMIFLIFFYHNVKAYLNINIFK